MYKLLNVKNLDLLMALYEKFASHMADTDHVRTYGAAKRHKDSDQFILLSNYGIKIPLIGFVVREVHRAAVDAPVEITEDVALCDDADVDILESGWVVCSENGEPLAGEQLWESRYDLKTLLTERYSADGNLNISHWDIEVACFDVNRVELSETITVHYVDSLDDPVSTLVDEFATFIAENVEDHTDKGVYPFMSGDDRHHVYPSCKSGASIYFAESKLYVHPCYFNSVNADNPPHLGYVATGQDGGVILLIKNDLRHALYTLFEKNHLVASENELVYLFESY